MSQPVCTVRDVPPADLGNALQRLFPLLTVERAQWVLGQLAERVERKRINDIVAVEATMGESLSCTAISVIQPANAASLLAIGSQAAANAAEHEAITRLLLRLRDLSVRFLQATTDSEQDQQRLRRLGFEHLAKLAVLVLGAETFSVANANDRETLRFLAADDDAETLDRICHIAELSFAETCDCPRLSKFRTATEIVEGFRQAPSFDGSLWRLALYEGKPAGCLILTHHRADEAHTASGESAVGGAVEISYMGLVPKYRKRGLGHVLLSEAVAIARLQNASRMVLAVDRENSPAIALYRSQGWTEAAQESVWGMQIEP